MSEGVRIAQVKVLCRSESHASEPFQWVFTRAMGRHGERVWVDDTAESTFSGSVPQASQHNRQPSVITVLADDDVVGSGSQVTSGRSYRQGKRHRYELTCRRCGEKLVVRGETMDRLLDGIAESRTFELSPGVSAVTMAGLAAIVNG